MLGQRTGGEKLSPQESLLGWPQCLPLPGQLLNPLSDGVQARPCKWDTKPATERGIALPAQTMLQGKQTCVKGPVISLHMPQLAVSDYFGNHSPSISKTQELVDTEIRDCQPDGQKLAAYRQTHPCKGVTGRKVTWALGSQLHAFGCLCPREGPGGISPLSSQQGRARLGAGQVEVDLNTGNTALLCTQPSPRAPSG